MKLRSILAGALALVLSASFAFAQINPGSSPLTPSKGGTNSAFVGFAGPASTVKTFTLPNASDTIATLGAIQTFSAAKTFSAALTYGGVTLANSVTGTGSMVLGTAPTLSTPVIGVATATSINKVAITAPATSATLTIPDGVTLTGPAASGTAMTLGNTETVTGVKTFGSAGAVGRLKVAGTTSGSTIVDATATASGTLTLPAVTDTLIAKATTDTLTNKTYDTAGAGNSFSINGVAATTNTGTGAVARAAGPTFTTPTLGAATATSISSPVLASAAATQFQTNGTTFAGNINTSQQWLLSGTNTTPVAGSRLTVSNNTAAAAANQPAESPTVQIVAADNAVASLQVSTFGTGGGAVLRLSQAGGTAAAPTATQSGQFIGAFTPNGFYTSGGPAYATGGGFVVSATENWTSTATGTRIDMYSSAVGSTTGVVASIAGGISIGDTIDPGGGAMSTTKSIKSKGATFGIGYATGAGGAVTQLTSRTTGVTLNNVSGAITLFAAAPAVGTWVSFTVTDSAVAATDVPHVSFKSGTNTYIGHVTAVAAGSFQISFTSIVGTASDSPVINFAIIKAVAN